MFFIYFLPSHHIYRKAHFSMFNIQFHILFIYCQTLLHHRFCFCFLANLKIIRFINESINLNVSRLYQYKGTAWLERVTTLNWRQILKINKTSYLERDDSLMFVAARYVCLWREWWWMWFCVKMSRCIVKQSLSQPVAVAPAPVSPVAGAAAIASVAVTVTPAPVAAPPASASDAPTSAGPFTCTVL